MQWLLQNIRVRVGFALKNPRCALSTLYGELTFSDERFLAGMCGVSPRAIRGFLDESSNTPEFAAHIANVAEEFRALSSVQRRPLCKKGLKPVRGNPCSKDEGPGWFQSGSVRHGLFYLGDSRELLPSLSSFTTAFTPVNT